MIDKTVYINDDTLLSLGTIQSVCYDIQSKEVEVVEKISTKIVFTAVRLDAKWNVRYCKREIWLGSQTFSNHTRQSH